MGRPDAGGPSLGRKRPRRADEAQAKYRAPRSAKLCCSAKRRKPSRIILKHNRDPPSCGSRPGSGRQLGGPRRAPETGCGRHVRHTGAGKKKGPSGVDGPSLGRKRPRRAAAPTSKLIDDALHNMNAAHKTSNAFFAELPLPRRGPAPRHGVAALNEVSSRDWLVRSAHTPQKEAVRAKRTAQV